MTAVRLQIVFVLFFDDGIKKGGTVIANCAPVPAIVAINNGAAQEIRTLDLSITNRMLYQLS